MERFGARGKTFAGQDGLHHVSYVLQAEMLRALDLRPVALSAGFASVRGSWKGAPVELKARAYEGGAIGYGRCIELWSGELSIGNALFLPRFDMPLPVFGLDVVAPGHGGVMVAADLSPMVPGASIDLLRVELPTGGELPQWCKRWFSPEALYTRLPLAELNDVAEPVLARVRALAATHPAPAPSREAEMAAAQRACCAAHLQDDKGLGILGRMFGETWAQRFLREVMFPA